MQTNQRYQFPPAQPTRYSAYPVSSILLNPRLGGSLPAGSFSTYAKIIAPGLLTATLWLHVWIGLAAAIAITVAAIAGLLTLQRLRTSRTGQGSWAKTVCFGERIWMNRLLIPIPGQLGMRITTLYLVSWAGAFIALLGGLTASELLAATGLIVAYSAQFVCFRKLIVLFTQMKDRTPLYRFWSSVPGNDNRKIRSTRTSGHR